MIYKTCLSKNASIRVTAGFPEYPSGGAHNGIDYVLSPDLTIYNCSEGIVLFSGKGTGYNESFGNFVSIKMANGQVAYYAHMRDLPLVQVGQRVEKGHPLGIMGATGNVTGEHVHVGLKSQEGAGNWIDPQVLTNIPNVVGTYEISFDELRPPDIPIEKACLFVISNHCEKFTELGNVYSNVGYLVKGISYPIVEMNGVQPDGFYWVKLKNGFYAVVLPQNCYIGECKSGNNKIAALIAVMKKKGLI